MFSTIPQNFVVALLMYFVLSLPRAVMDCIMKIFLDLSLFVCFELWSLTRVEKMLMMMMISFRVFHADLIY